MTATVWARSQADAEKRDASAGHLDEEPATTDDGSDHDEYQRSRVVVGSWSLLVAFQVASLVFRIIRSSPSRNSNVGTENVHVHDAGLDFFDLESGSSHEHRQSR